MQGFLEAQSVCWGGTSCVQPHDTHAFYQYRRQARCRSIAKKRCTHADRWAGDGGIKSASPRRTFVLSSIGIVMISGCDGSSASL